MEAVTKKTIMIEFEGRKHVLPDDSTIEDLLIQLGLAPDMPVRLEVKGGGFVLLRNN